MDALSFLTTSIPGYFAIAPLAIVLVILVVLIGKKDTPKEVPVTATATPTPTPAVAPTPTPDTATQTVPSQPPVAQVVEQAPAPAQVQASIQTPVETPAQITEQTPVQAQVPTPSPVHEAPSEWVASPVQAQTHAHAETSAITQESSPATEMSAHGDEHVVPQSHPEPVIATHPSAPNPASIPPISSWKPATPTPVATGELLGESEAQMQAKAMAEETPHAQVTETPASEEPVHTEVATEVASVPHDQVVASTSGVVPEVSPVHEGEVHPVTADEVKV